MALTVTINQSATEGFTGTNVTFTVTGGQDDYYSFRYGEDDTSLGSLVYFTGGTYTLRLSDYYIGREYTYAFVAENNNPEDEIRGTFTVEDHRLTVNITEPAPYDYDKFCQGEITEGRFNVTNNAGEGRITVRLKEVHWDEYVSSQGRRPTLVDLSQPELSPFGANITELTVDDGETIDYIWHPELTHDITVELENEDGNVETWTDARYGGGNTPPSIIPILTHGGATYPTRIPWVTPLSIDASLEPFNTPDELTYILYLSRVNHTNSSINPPLVRTTLSTITDYREFDPLPTSTIRIYSPAKNNVSGVDVDRTITWGNRHWGNTNLGSIEFPDGTYEITFTRDNNCPSQTTTFTTPSRDGTSTIPNDQLPTISYVPPSCSESGLGGLYIDFFEDTIGARVIAVNNDTNERVDLVTSRFPDARYVAGSRNQLYAQADPGSYSFYFLGTYDWYTNTITRELTEGVAPRIEFLRWIYPECDNGNFSRQKVEFVIHGGNKPFGYELSTNQSRHPHITTFDTIPNTPVQADYRDYYTHIYATDSIGCIDAFQLPNPPTDDPLWQPSRLYVPLVVNRRPIPVQDCALDNFGAEELTFDVTLGEGREDLEYPLNFNFSVSAFDSVFSGFFYDWAETVVVNNPNDTATVTIPNPGDVPEGVTLYAYLNVTVPGGCHRVDGTILNIDAFTGAFKVNSTYIQNVSEHGGSDGQINLGYRVGPTSEGESLSLEQSHDNGPWTLVGDITYNTYQYGYFTIRDLTAGEYRFRAISNDDPTCVKIVDTITITQPAEPPIYDDRVTYTKDGVSTTVSSLGGYGIEEIHWPGATVYLETLILHDEDKNGYEIFVEDGQLITRAIS